MISIESYILFVAPFLMGAAGLMLYLITLYVANRSGRRTPAE